MQTSCGYGVPFLSELAELEAHADGPRSRLEDRKTLGHWASQQVEKDVMQEYQAKNNRRSLDGLAGLRAARRTRNEMLWLEDAKIWAKRMIRQWDALLLGALLTVLVILLTHTLPHALHVSQQIESI